MPSADLEAHNAADHRSEDHGEQGAYVEQQKDFPHQVSDRQHQSRSKSEEDIAARGAGSYRLRLYNDSFYGRLGNCHASLTLFLTSVSTHSATSSGGRPVVVTVM